MIRLSHPVGIPGAGSPHGRLPLGCTWRRRGATDPKGGNTGAHGEQPEVKLRGKSFTAQSASSFAPALSTPSLLVSIARYPPQTPPAPLHLPPSRTSTAHRIAPPPHPTPPMNGQVAIPAEICGNAALRCCLSLRKSREHAQRWERRTGLPMGPVGGGRGRHGGRHGGVCRGVCWRRPRAGGGEGTVACGACQEINPQAAPVGWPTAGACPAAGIRPLTIRMPRVIMEGLIIPWGTGGLVGPGEGPQAPPPPPFRFRCVNHFLFSQSCFRKQSSLFTWTSGPSRAFRPRPSCC